MVRFLWHVTVSDVAQTAIDSWIALKPQFDVVWKNMLWRLTFTPRHRFEELGHDIYCLTQHVNDQHPDVTFICRWGGPKELVVLDVRMS